MRLLILLLLCVTSATAGMRDIDGPIADGGTFVVYLDTDPMPRIPETCPESFRECYRDEALLDCWNTWHANDGHGLPLYRELAGAQESHIIYWGRIEYCGDVDPEPAEILAGNVRYDATRWNVPLDWGPGDRLALLVNRTERYYDSPGKRWVEDAVTDTLFADWIIGTRGSVMAATPIVQVYPFVTPLSVGDLLRVYPRGDKRCSVFAAFRKLYGHQGRQWNAKRVIGAVILKCP